MKLLVEDYTFNKTTKQVILTGFTDVPLSRFLVITNVTSNVIIYLFSNPLKGGTVVGNVLTLDFDTTSMNDADKLQIYIDNAESPATAENQGVLHTLVSYLKKLLIMSRSSSVVDIMGRQRVAVDNVVNAYNMSYPISTFANHPSQTAPGHGNTATTYYQPTWAGPVDPRWTNMQNAKLAYNTGIRANLKNT